MGRVSGWEVIDQRTCVHICMAYGHKRVVRAWGRGRGVNEGKRDIYIKYFQQ